jgi:iron(III) transport system ATP-binding protein
MPTIRLRNVHKTYGGNANAVSALDLEIADGEFMCLLGPSGCGKTTTLRMIAGLEHLSDGEIEIGARKVDSVAEGIFVPPEKREIGLVFQSYALWPHLDIERNTDFGLRVRKVPKVERQARVEEILRTLGIEQYRDRYPSQLSGGQQQRVALARMLVVRPEVLLLDEPLANLDARLRLEMRAELKRLHEAFRTTIVFVTHDQWEAMTLATTIAVMREGRLQQVGAPGDIYSRPANRFVAEFVGNPPINIIELDQGGSALADAMRTYLDRLAVAEKDIASVGIRPEAIRVATDAASVPENAFRAPARITGVLPTGGSWIIELASGSERVFQLMHEPARPSLGSAVTLWAPPEALHLFGRDGRRFAGMDRQIEPEEVN